MAIAAMVTATPNLELPHALDHVLVMFHPGKSPSNIQERAKGMPNLLKMPVLPGENVQDALARWSALEDVEIAEPDYIATAAVTPNDASYSVQWAMPKIAADVAWDQFTGSAAQKICIVDTGVDYSHPDLAGNCAPGYNAITGVNDAIDDNSHGTHCAGVIGASANNAQGVAGINWNVSILPCKFMSAAGSGYISDAIECWYWCQQNGATISSNSWALGTESVSLYNAMVDLGSQGHLFIAAAGNQAVDNDGTLNVTYPAKYNLASQINVASSTSSDTLSSFSSYGATTVHLAAPGSSIYSTVLNGGYTYKSGTSMATPHVAGTVALMKAANPALSAADLKAKLLANVDVVSALAGKVSTSGRLNTNNALNAALAAVVVPSPSPSVAASPPPPPAIVVSPSPPPPVLEPPTPSPYPPPSPSPPPSPEVLVPSPSPPPPTAVVQPSPPPPTADTIPPPAPKPKGKPKKSRKLSL
jgi:thermitase